MEIGENSATIREKLNKLGAQTETSCELTMDILGQVFDEIPPDRRLDEEPIPVTVGDFIARRVEELSIVNTRLRAILACLQEQFGDLKVEK